MVASKWCQEKTRHEVHREKDDKKMETRLLKGNRVLEASADGPTLRAWKGRASESADGSRGPVRHPKTRKYHVEQVWDSNILTSAFSK